MEKKHVLQSVHAELIAAKLNEFYGDFGKFSNHEGNVRMESMSRIEPFLFSEISCFAAGYKLSLDELATLTALLREAGEALEPFTHEDLRALKVGNASGEESIIFARNEADLKIKHFARAAKLRKRIQEVVG